MGLMMALGAEAFAGTPKNVAALKRAAMRTADQNLPEFLTTRRGYRHNNSQEPQKISQK